MTSADITAGRAGPWADRIRPHLVAAVDNIITAGRELIDAKEALGHGEFLELVQMLDLKPRTAQKFMSIARNEALTNASPGTHLPASWTTLYELSRMPVEDLQRAIGDGQVTSDMSRKEALHMAARHRTSPDVSLEALEIQIRRAQWEMGALIVGSNRDPAVIAAIVEAVDPEVLSLFSSPEGFVLTCADIFDRFREPDFTRHWDNQPNIDFVGGAR